MAYGEELGPRAREILDEVAEPERDLLAWIVTANDLVPTLSPKDPTRK